MEARGALSCVSAGKLDGIAALERDRVPLSSREPDGSASENVYRGNDLELTC